MKGTVSVRKLFQDACPWYSAIMLQRSPNEATWKETWKEPQP